MKKITLSLYRRLIILIPSVIVISLLAATYARNTIWKDGLSLWQDVVRNSPNKARGFSNLGYFFENKNLYDIAINYYDRAVAIKPDYYEAYFNRGSAHLLEGQYDMAITDYSRAIAINPNFIAAYVTRGNAYSNKGQYDMAIEDFQRACNLGSAEGCKLFKGKHRRISEDFGTSPVFIYKLKMFHSA